MTPPVTIPLGGKVRFPGVGKGQSNTSGWAFLFKDGLGGAYGDWSTDLSETWHATHDLTATPAERAAHTRRVAELQRISQEEKTKQHTEVAERAQAIMDQAIPAPADHPYLQLKQVQPHGLRVDNENRLIVPVRIDGRISSLQTIDLAGEKRFIFGGKKEAAATPLAIRMRPQLF
jgi:putative DNA primase/helicase